MHIGVVFSDWNPQSGGAFTYESTLFDALGRLCGASRHRWTAFVHGAPRSVSQPASSSLDVVALPSKQALGERLRVQMSRALRVCTKQGRRELRYGQRRKWREEFLLRSGVDMLWYPQPSCLTLDLPYVMVLWDLQHRLQPYFPEVSLGAEWEQRERNYALTLRRATRIITGTTVGQREIERFYQVPSERICVLPQPTPTFALAAPPPGDAEREVLARHGLRPGYLFYPAQFWPHKNHVGLLKALAVLRDEHRLTLPLVLVGSDKGNLPHVRGVAEELGLAEQVTYLGFVSQTDLVALYRGAAATTFVTYFGPDNLPPLESFALGCPVIASAVPGAEEQLADAALLVDPRNPRAIASAIANLHHNADLRQQLIARGHDRAQRFHADDFLQALFAQFDHLEPIRDCWRQAS